MPFVLDHLSTRSNHEQLYLQEALTSELTNLRTAIFVTEGVFVLEYGVIGSFMSGRGRPVGQAASGS
jgi:hypothetical protein